MPKQTKRKTIKRKGKVLDLEEYRDKNEPFLVSVLIKVEYKGKPAGFLWSDEYELYGETDIDIYFDDEIRRIHNYNTLIPETFKKFYLELEQEREAMEKTK